MGIALIVLGLIAAAVVVDFAIENDLAGAPDHSFSLFGGSFTFNQTEVVLGGAVLGALAVLLVVLGIGLSRGSWGRRRALKHRVSELERQNDELRSGEVAIVEHSVGETSRGPDEVRVRTEDEEERRTVVEHEHHPPRP